MNHPLVVGGPPQYLNKSRNIYHNAELQVTSPLITAQPPHQELASSSSASVTGSVFALETTL